MTPRWLTPGRLFAGLLLLGWGVVLLSPRLLELMGIYEYGTRFLDSYAVLAALDAVRAGHDPTAAANPLDPLLRNHVYSSWWLELKWLGLTRAHNLAVGVAWVAAFGAAAWASARPANRREALWLAALLLSPVVLLAVDRANNDLVIFVLLAGAGLAAARGGTRWWGLAIAAVGLATGLKYYPIAALGLFVWIRPVRAMPAVLGAAVVVAALALGSVLSDLGRAPMTVGPGIYTMGAPIIWRDHGFSDGQAWLPGVALLLGLGGVLAATRITRDLATAGELSERLLAALSGCLLLTCFVSGINFSYRWIFVLWLARWAWRRAQDAGAASGRRVAALACGLIAFCLWSDGLLCLVVNHLPPQSQEWVTHLTLVFRWWTQPLVWMLMALITGWLIEGTWATWREWRQAAVAKPAGRAA